MVGKSKSERSVPCSALNVLQCLFLKYGLLDRTGASPFSLGIFFPMKQGSCETSRSVNGLKKKRMVTEREQATGVLALIWRAANDGRQYALLLSPKAERSRASENLERGVFGESHCLPLPPFRCNSWLLVPYSSCCAPCQTPSLPRRKTGNENGPQLATMDRPPRRRPRAV